MEPSLPTEVILSHPKRSLGSVRLNWSPQPGSYLDLEGKTYAVLERHHRYQFHAGKYRLQKIALYVQAVQRPAEQTQLNGCWIIGNASCRYNARSELMRCAVNPAGPCEGCKHYDAIEPAID